MGVLGLYDEQEEGVTAWWRRPESSGPSAGGLGAVGPASAGGLPGAAPATGSDGDEEDLDGGEMISEIWQRHFDAIVKPLKEEVGKLEPPDEMELLKSLMRSDGHAAAAPQKAAAARREDLAEGRRQEDPAEAAAAGHYPGAGRSAGAAGAAAAG